MAIKWTGGIKIPTGGGVRTIVEPIPVPPPNFENTWDSVSADAAEYTVSNGGLTVELSGQGFHTIRTLGSVSSGKYYTEFTLDFADPNYILGVVTVDAVTGFLEWPGIDLEGYGYYGSAGQKIRGGPQVAYGDAFTGGDIIGMALDLDNGAIWWSKNGTWQDNDEAAVGIVSADIAAYNSTAVDGAAFTGVTGTYFVGASLFAIPMDFTSNFGATAFDTTPPTGFIGWPGP